MKEVLRLRPHHASVLFDYYDVPEARILEALNGYGYDEETKRTILDIIAKLHDPQTLIGILPVGDIEHDSICKTCVVQKRVSRCGDTSIPGAFIGDKWYSKHSGLTPGRVFTSKELHKHAKPSS